MHFASAAVADNHSQIDIEHAEQYNIVCSSFRLCPLYATPRAILAFPSSEKLQETFETLREARFGCYMSPKVSWVPCHVEDRDIT